MPDWVTPAHWPGQGDFLTWCQNMGPAMAMVLMFGGVIYLTYGRRFHRTLVTFNAAVIGGYIGSILLDGAQGSMVGAVLGSVMAAAIAWPFTKYSVAVTGGIFGIALGAAVWRLCDLDPKFAWSGGMIGMVFFGMLSFILYDMSVLVFMCGQGAAMLVFGLLGMAYKYPDIAAQIGRSLTGRPLALPIVIGGAAAGGWWWQRKKGGGTAAPSGGKGGKDAR